jgi:hypothetical protein
VTVNSNTAEAEARVQINILLAMGDSIIIGSQGAGTADTEGRPHVRRRKRSPSKALSSHLVASTIDYKHDIGPEETALHTDEGIRCRRVSAGQGRKVACEGEN